MHWTSLVIVPSSQEAGFCVSESFCKALTASLHQDCVAHLTGESIVEWRTTINHEWQKSSTILKQPIPYTTVSLDRAVLKKRRDILIARCAVVENKK
jgi:hypothetical protein